MNFQHAIEFFFSLLAILDPVAAIPVFVSLTANHSPAEKRKTAIVSGISVVVILIVFFFIGARILDFFSISVDAFRIAGGIILLMMGINMVSSKPTKRQSREEQLDAEHKEQVAVVPLAIPLLAGPGAISTLIIASKKFNTFSSQMEISGMIVLLGAIVALVYMAAGPIGRLLKSTGISITTKIMGLILTSVAVGMIIDSMQKLLPGLAH